MKSIFFLFRSSGVDFSDQSVLWKFSVLDKNKDGVSFIYFWQIVAINLQNINIIDGHWQIEWAIEQIFIVNKTRYENEKKNMKPLYNIIIHIQNYKTL